MGPDFKQTLLTIVARASHMLAYQNNNLEVLDTYEQLKQAMTNLEWAVENRCNGD